MSCRIQELRNKEVICIRDGTMLGCVSDVEIDIKTAQVISLVIRGRYRFFGLLGREDDCIVAWQDIEVIGEDTILISSAPSRLRRKRGIVSSLFGNNVQ